RYIEALVQVLGDGRALHLLHSAGGMMSVEAAKAKPLAMAASGPAAGVAAAAHLARTLRVPRALAFDMGGTTTDVCLINDGIAETALTALGRALKLSMLETAHGIFEVANANMLRALRLVSVQRGYDLRDFTLIAYGGAGPMHAVALARQAGIRRVVVPVHSGAFSALGCLVSPLRYDAVQTFRARLAGWEKKPADDR